MKKILIGACLLLTSFLFVPRTEAQVRIGLNINIGDQPAWRVPGYDYAEYYYMPEIETYYWVPRHQFIYFSNGQWVFSASLPSRYHDYDLYHGYKVVVNRPNAYRYHDEDRRRYVNYPHYYGNHDNDNRNNGNRYNDNRNNGNRNNNNRDNDNHNDNHDNGNHNGWNKQKGHH